MKLNDNPFHLLMAMIIFGFIVNHVSSDSSDDIIRKLKASISHKEVEKEVHCGPGTMMFGSEPGKARHTLASTSNYLSSHSFSLSSGTSGCNPKDVIYSNAKQKIFIKRNYDSIKQDIATGSGDYILTLSDLMGCPAHTRDVYTKVAQDNFKEIYIHDKNNNSNSSDWILYRLKKKILLNHTLNKECSKIWRS